MDFNRKDIHTIILKATRYSELTIDDDFNIPDTKEDIAKIVAKSGHIIIDEVIPTDGKVKVTGTVVFKVLYKTATEKQDIEVYEGEILFEDQVNVDGVSHNHQAESFCKLEDITVSMINSRKIEVRGLIGNVVSVFEENQVNGATDLENGQGIECQYKNAVITETVINKRDMFKIKEDVEIPQNKPNIRDITWSQIELRNMDIKAVDGAINVRGEVEIFVIYKGMEEHLPIQYVFLVKSISREIECQGAKAGMIIEANTSIGKGDVVIRQDQDGEDRIIGVDYSVDMNIKMYEDMDIRFLSDMYSPDIEIEPKKECFSYENLLMRNQAKAKVSYRKRISGDDTKLLQICHIYGNVDVDDVVTNKDNIQVIGVIKACILYISTDDNPMNSMEIDIPFEYAVDTVTLSKDDSVRIVPSIDMLNATLLNSEEVEIKAQLNLGISIFSKTETEIITDVTISDIDYEKKANMPGIVGYVVKKGDTIWSIARKYYATTSSIKAVNHLDTDYVSEGDRLIIVKS